MARSWWINEATGDRLDRRELEMWRRRAQALYRANSHIFEDEMDALAALGVVPAGEAARPTELCASP